ncbi:hypothetical protein [Mesorhizobium huakuii]|uniref:Uncharacterized protein n=1 Tax=Mesorhizobium huakuii TaxID=28104 RepID=A0A7G6STN9_9HYPH|nr:hypothetical protein [Mesorhizobium huakuii]QND57871.1 hypothetical protein HB778_15635 [Mesorhizobium huakuii]
MKLSDYEIDSATGRAVAKLATGMRLASAELSSDDIKTLFSSPVEVIAAPGSGKALVPTEMAVLYRFGTTAFSTETDGDLSSGYFHAGGSVDTALMAFDMLGEAASAYGYGLNFGQRPVADIANKGLMFGVANLDPMDGDGTAVLTVIYRVVDVATGQFL